MESPAHIACAALHDQARRSRLGWVRARPRRARQHHRRGRGGRRRRAPRRGHLAGAAAPAGFGAQLARRRRLRAADRRRDRPRRTPGCARSWPRRATARRGAHGVRRGRAQRVVARRPPGGGPAGGPARVRAGPVAVGDAPIDGGRAARAGGARGPDDPWLHPGRRRRADPGQRGGVRPPPRTGGDGRRRPGRADGGAVVRPRGPAAGLRRRPAGRLPLDQAARCRPRRGVRRGRRPGRPGPRPREGAHPRRPAPPDRPGRRRDPAVRRVRQRPGRRGLLRARVHARRRRHARDVPPRVGPAGGSGRGSPASLDEAADPRLSAADVRANRPRGRRRPPGRPACPRR